MSGASVTDADSGRPDDQGPLPGRSVRPPRWVDAAVVLVALLFAAGGVIALVRPALLVASGADIDPAARVYAGYLASRDCALAVALIVLLVLRARQLLAGALLLAALVQAMDIVVDAGSGRLVLVPGLVLLAALMIAAATRLARRPVWRAASWRERSADR
jgi:hypothetical protein